MARKSYEIKVNNVADAVWEEFQDELKLDIPRPRIIFSDEEKNEAFDLASEKFNLGKRDSSQEGGMSYSKDEKAHGLTCTAFKTDVNSGTCLFGPIKIYEIPKDLLKLVLEHELSHYISWANDPYFYQTMVITQVNRSYQPKGTSGKIIDYLVNGGPAGRDRDAMFTKMFNETLAWIVPTQRSGVEKVKEHLEIYYKKHDENDINYMINLANHDNGAALHVRNGYGAEVLLDPIKIMNRKHPLINNRDFRKAASNFKRDYKFNRRNYKLERHFDTEEGLI